MILAALLLAAQAQAPANPDDTRFRQCTALARSQPDQAIQQAEAWRSSGGGVRAQRCSALAYVTLGRWAPAATVYEQAAQAAARASDPATAELWVQSGNAWLAAQSPARAIAAFDAALATNRLTDAQKGQVHVDRARAQVQANNPAAARTDLDRALQLTPEDATAWYLSAALARRAGDLRRATTDIARAATLAPNDADILLLSGTLAGLNGNMAEAERRYRRVVEIAPQSEAATTARASLGPDEAPTVAAPAPASGSSTPRPQ